MGKVKKTIKAITINADNCNGCRRCLADCPYAAIVMVPHPGGIPGRQLAQVIPGQERGG